MSRFDHGRNGGARPVKLGKNPVKTGWETGPAVTWLVAGPGTCAGTARGLLRGGWRGVAHAAVRSFPFLFCFSAQKSVAVSGHETALVVGRRPD